jgi:hypothetical protein
MKMLQSEKAKRDVNRAINTRNGPTSHEVLELPLGTEVLVWRERKGWTGPYEIQNIDGRNVTIHLENGPLTVRCTQVKPYHRAEPQATRMEEQLDPDEPVPPRIEPEQPRKRGRPRKEEAAKEAKSKVEETQPRRRGRPRKHPVQPEEAFFTQKEKSDYALAIKLRTDGIITTPGAPFEESDRTEIEALIANGTFQILMFDPNKHKGRIFNLRLVREIKGKSTQPYEKSRLVFAGHSDTEKEEILTQSPTIQKMSQRLLLAIGVSLMATYDMQCELRDIIQAYIQSKDELLRTLYARPPKDLKNVFPPDTIFRIVRPLYGAAESGLYWFKTYHNHHKDKLKMEVSSYDPCLLVTREGQDMFGITGLQTDDTLSIVTADFS